MPEISARLPHYQYLYETLRQQLHKGVYEIGSLLPSEKELQVAYNLTQPTIRQALSMLAEEGYIKKYQGKGSVVQPLPIGSGMLSIEPQMASDVLIEGEIQTEILQKPTLGAFPSGFLFVPAQPSSLYYYLERLRRVKEEVIFYEKIALPADELPHFPKQKLDNRSLFEVLRQRYNVIVKGGEEKVWASAATSPLTEIMGIEAGTPILRLEKRIETNRPHLTFYSSLFACTDKYLLQGRF
jgi:GntR family transcriptional regulator, frlABCD operon transcriptional regulator